MGTITDKGKNQSESGYRQRSVTFDEHVRRMRAFRKSHHRRRDPGAVLFTGIPTLRLSNPCRERGGTGVPHKYLLTLVPQPRVILPKGSSN